MSKNQDNNIEKTEQEEIPLTPMEAVYEWFSAIIFAVVIIFLVLTFVGRQVSVNGPSMNDTLQHQDKLIITNFLYQPQNGDIIVAAHGENYDDAIIKRVIATEGQKIEIDYDNNKVIVDGKTINEPYVKGATVRIPDPLEIPDKIPEGYVFVMGDNREDSVDSRSNIIGLIPVQNIIGKAVFRVYPFDSFGSIQ